MRVSTRDVMGTPLYRQISLNKRERATLLAAADLLAQLDELAASTDPDWEDWHPQRADLVLGESAIRELAIGGTQHVHDVL